MLKRKMNRINIILKRIINSVIFRKILVIFVMGLVSRFVVNGVFDDVNVLKEYTSYILLVYYSIMACFELSIISFNVLDIKLVKDAIKMFCEGGFLNKDKMLSGDVMSSSNMDSNKVFDLPKDNLNYNQRGAASGKIYGRRSSAGLKGLYNQDSSNRNGSSSDKSVTPGKNVRRLERRE